MLKTVLVPASSTQSPALESTNQGLEGLLVCMKPTDQGRKTSAAVDICYACIMQEATQLSEYHAIHANATIYSMHCLENIDLSWMPAGIIKA